jgi:hypothetical protein
LDYELPLFFRIKRLLHFQNIKKTTSVNGGNYEYTI